MEVQKTDKKTNQTGLEFLQANSFRKEGNMVEFTEKEKRENQRIDDLFEVDGII